MVTSSSAGQRWEAWWSTVPSIRFFRRLDGTGMLHCRGCRRAAARGGLVPGILGRSSPIAPRQVMARAASQDIVVLGSRRKARLEAIARRPSSPQSLVRRAGIGRGAGEARAASQDIVVLGSRRKARLEAIARRPSSPQSLVRRAGIVLLAHQGWANAQIAAALGCSAGTVRTWRRRFARGGIPALADRPRSGRPEGDGADVRPALG